MALPGSSSIRVGGYVVVAALMLLARRRERRLVGDVDGTWPVFWLMACGLLIAMAAGRAVEAGNLLATLGRRAAQDHDWYASRRPIQAALVGGLAVASLVVVIVALSRTPERRRRYLPVGLASLTLVTLAGVRVVSLHQIDSFVHGTEVGGARVGSIIEVALLIMTGLATMWCPPGRGVPSIGCSEMEHASVSSGGASSSDPSGASADQRSGALPQKDDANGP